MKQIIFASPTMGYLDLEIKPNGGYPNTFQIGNKRMNFDELFTVDQHIDLRKADDYTITIYDGFYLSVEIIYDGKKYTGHINRPSGINHEELIFEKD